MGLARTRGGGGKEIRKLTQPLASSSAQNEMRGEDDLVSVFVSVPSIILSQFSEAFKKYILSGFFDSRIELSLWRGSLTSLVETTTF